MQLMRNFYRRSAYKPFHRLRCIYRKGGLSRSAPLYIIAKGVRDGVSARG